MDITFSDEDLPWLGLTSSADSLDSFDGFQRADVSVNMSHPEQLGPTSSVQHMMHDDCNNNIYPMICSANHPPQVCSNKFHEIDWSAVPTQDPVLPGFLEDSTTTTYLSITPLNRYGWHSVAGHDNKSCPQTNSAMRYGHGEKLSHWDAHGNGTRHGDWYDNSHGEEMREAPALEVDIIPDRYANDSITADALTPSMGTPQIPRRPQSLPSNICAVQETSDPQAFLFHCTFPRCRKRTFGRWYDFNRHYKGAHAVEKTVFWCPVAGCVRSEGGNNRPFPRKDKMATHALKKHGIGDGGAMFETGAA